MQRRRPCRRPLSSSQRRAFLISNHSNNSSTLPLLLLRSRLRTISSHSSSSSTTDNRGNGRPVRARSHSVSGTSEKRRLMKTVDRPVLVRRRLWRVLRLVLVPLHRLFQGAGAPPALAIFHTLTALLNNGIPSPSRSTRLASSRSSSAAPRSLPEKHVSPSPSLSGRDYRLAR